MKSCPKCGCSLSPEKPSVEVSPDQNESNEEMDEESSIKTSILDELLGVLDDSTASQFAASKPSGKPKAVSIEIVSAKEDEEEEDQ